MRAASSLLAVLCGCQQPRLLVFCHNANCAGDPDPSRDDTIERLRAGLALDLDGVELDLLWDSPRDRCAFAHDTASAPARADASVAIDEVLAWLDGRAGSYTVVLDLKPSGHREPLAACALDQLDRLERAGAEVRLGSVDADLLRALRRDPRAEGRDLHMATDVTMFRPIDGDPRAEFAGLPFSSLVAHPRWVTPHRVQAVRDIGASLTFWSIVMTVEALDAIERYEPSAVTTGDAEFLRDWRGH